MKKEVKAYIGDSRRTWNISPVTKVVQSKKNYKRNREKNGLKHLIERGE